MIRASKITVCGGGNGAQTLVPVAARSLGCPVDIYAPIGDEAERLGGSIRVTGAVQAEARPRRASADPAEVIPGSAVVVMVVPAFAHESTLHQIVPFLDEGAWVGAIPARGGLFCCATRILEEVGRDDVGLFGLQTLPWACRIREYGREVHVLGIKKAVDAASRPGAQSGQITPLLERMLGLAVDTAANGLALTLANTGQLIHPGIMYSLFGSWNGAPFPAEEVPEFYHSLSEEGASVLAGLSDEVQAIRSRLASELDLTAVRPLKSWLLHSYGEAITDASTLRSAFVSNQAYAGLMAPVREVALGQVVPDLNARYLAEDVPFGLVVTRAIAGLAAVETPTMDEVIAWAGAQLGKDYLSRDAAEARIPQNYGLNSLEQLIDFAIEAQNPFQEIV